MSSKVRRVLISLLAVVALVYVGLGALLYLFQDRLLFLALPPDPGALERLKPYAVEVATGDVVLRGWLVPAREPDRPTVVYYGGNAEELSRLVNYLGSLGDYNYLYVNYRGYGESEGTPSDAALLSDATAVLDRLAEEGRIDGERLILVGRSLGSCIATYVAAERNPSALILLSPYDSIVAVAGSHYPIYPVKLLMRHHFDCLQHAERVHVPTLILLAEDDRVIPRKHSVRVIKAWRGPLQTEVIPGTTHNAFVGRAGEFFTIARAFLSAFAPDG